MTLQHASDLTPKHRRFLDEYLIDMNARQAAIRAGYAARSAQQVSARLLVREDVRRALSVAIAERAQRTRVTADEVVEELARIAFSDLRTVVAGDGSLRPPAEMDRSTRAAIRSFKVRRGAGRSELTEVRFWNKLDALELLGKHLGLFRIQVEIGAGQDLAAQIAAGRRRVTERR